MAQIILMTGLAVCLTAVQPYLDVVQNVKEVLYAWIMVATYVLLLFRLISSTENSYSTPITALMVGGVVVQIISVIGLSWLKFLLVKRLVPYVEEAVEEYIRENPEEASHFSRRRLSVPEVDQPPEAGEEGEFGPLR